jgi:hypothetical protein
MRLSDALLMAAGAAGLVAFLLLYRSATPQAAVTLEVTRGEALATARDLLETRGASPGSFKEAVQFRGNSAGLVFLQRTLGLDEASRWAREEVPIWSWIMRWFQPGEKEEWLVRVAVDGTVVGLAHLVEEAAAGADLASSRGRGGSSPLWSAWRRPVRSWTTARTITSPGRRRARMWPGALTPPRPGRVRCAWRWTCRATRSVATGTTCTCRRSLGLTFVLVVAALAITIARHRRDDIRWGPAARLAALVTVLFLGQGVASWPAVKFVYETEFQWVAYLGVLVIGALFVAAIYGMWVLFTATAGESLARETFPKSLVGFVEAARGRLLDTSVARASVRGYALGFLILGYLTVFYVVARRYLGAWLPAEGPYSEIFNTYLPFLVPLTVSVVAALTEELTYRLFGISLFKRYLRSTALALLIPAVIWAFAHSNYPVFPIYLRGIELTIAGVILGIGFLRLGLLACIIAHFVVDAVIFGMPLLTSGNGAYVLSGVIVVGIALAPAILGVVARIRAPAASPPQQAG